MIINKTRKILSKDTLVTLYYSFVHPYLNYTIELWGSTTQYNLNSLHKMQKKIVRMICKVPYRSHTASLFQDLKIFNIHNIYHYHMCLLMFKIYKGQSPLLLRNMFTLSDNVNNTRQMFNYNLPLFRLAICQKSFGYKGVKIWNYIVSHVNLNFTTITFKKHVKRHLLNNDILI